MKFLTNGQKKKNIKNTMVIRSTQCLTYKFSAEKCREQSPTVTEHLTIGANTQASKQLRLSNEN